ACRQYAAEDRLLDAIGTDAAALQRGADRGSAEFRRGGILEVALETAHRGAGRTDDDDGVLQHHETSRNRPQRGAMRSAPSRRMTSPFSMTFSIMWRTSAANSTGLPRRGGKGTLRPSESCTSCGMPAIIGVSKMPGAMETTRMPERASSRAIGSVMAATPPLEAA